MRADEIQADAQPADPRRFLEETPRSLSRDNRDSGAYHAGSALAVGLLCRARRPRVRPSGGSGKGIETIEKRKLRLSSAVISGTHGARPPLLNLVRHSNSSMNPIESSLRSRISQCLESEPCASRACFSLASASPGYFFGSKRPRTHVSGTRRSGSRRPANRLIFLVGVTSILATSTPTIDARESLPTGNETAVEAAQRDDGSLRSAFRPLVRPALPITKSPGAAGNPIDAFIQARLEAAGLRAAPEAPAPRLVRRLYLDLLGRPPSPLDVAEFARDERPDAWERLVDRLLASPEFAAQQARYWLDLVRYSESDGFRQDAYRPLAWKYRDWVIEAIAADLPFERFVAEQLAGDELDSDDPRAAVATGFLRLWPYEHNQRDLHKHRDEILNDLTSVTGAVFLGSSLECARCHDHKFDPILQADYFRLRAFFEPLQPVDGTLASSRSEREAHEARVRDWELATAELRARLAEIEAPARRSVEREAYEKFHPTYQRVLDAQPSSLDPLEKQIRYLASLQLRVPEAELEKRIPKSDRARWEELRSELAKLPAPNPLPGVLSVSDVGPAAPPTLIPGRETIGEIAPGFLEVLEARPPEIEPRERTTGRRSALAKWIGDRENALVLRVFVNRLWQRHFGRGIVATPNDFGRLGAPPTHPELLDWLASEFVAEGGRSRPIHRLILTSDVYRRDSLVDSRDEDGRRAIAVDPENRLLHRMPVRRVDAETLRDAMLFVSGELDPRAGGPSDDDEKSLRRSIYQRVFRNSPASFRAVFDGPDVFASCAQRDVTTTAPQALFLLNNEWTLERARAFALRLADSPDEKAAIDRAYIIAFGRAPVAREIAAVQEFLVEKKQERDGIAGATRTASLRDAPRLTTAEFDVELWTDIAHVLLNSNEFLYAD
jgi:hypothetical protein